jgi:hypothetical protein
MAGRDDLERWVLEAVDAHDGEASVIDIHRYVWDYHEADLRNSGDLFYTWGYEIRWAGQRLRDQGSLMIPRRGVWARPRGTI